MIRSNTMAAAALTEVENGAIRTELQIVAWAGVSEGEHGVHIHELGACEHPDFKSAGSHYNPHDQAHGLLNPEGPHAGDLPNIRFDADGNATYDVLTQRVTLDEARLLSSGKSATSRKRTVASIRSSASACPNAAHAFGHEGQPSK